MSGQSLFNTWKNRFSSYPRIYAMIRFILNPGIRFYLKERDRIIDKLLKNEKILNLGSGGALKGKNLANMVNIDMAKSRNVDVIGDIQLLPFRDNSFKGVLMEFVLEHVDNYKGMISESKRVLKDGGVLFVEVPFMYEYHDAPSDYRRFSLQGLAELFSDFEKLKSGVDIGPTGTLNAVLRNYISIILCFKSSRYCEILSMCLGIFFFPLKFLDYILLRSPNAQRIASSVYFIGRKPHPEDR